MISNIKNKISEYVAIKKFAQNQNSENDFKKFFTKSKKVLIILPNNPIDFSLEALDMIRFVSIHKKKLYLIHKLELEQLLPRDFGFASIIIKDNDKNVFGLPNADLIRKIKIYTIDLVIDLNIESDIFSSSLSNIPKANFRIGFIKNKSDSFYNYQIPSEINSEKSYRNLVNSLRMF